MEVGVAKEHLVREGLFGIRRIFHLLVGRPRRVLGGGVSDETRAQYEAEDGQLHEAGVGSHGLDWLSVRGSSVEGRVAAAPPSTPDTRHFFFTAYTR